MALALPTGLPILAERAVDRLVRVLSWTYRRDDETVRCRLALTTDCSAYELKIRAPWSTAAGSVELFDDALSALERQGAIERELIKAGFALESFHSAAEAH
jgi:hypothetical protein